MASSRKLKLLTLLVVSLSCAAADPPVNGVRIVYASPDALLLDVVERVIQGFDNPSGKQLNPPSSGYSWRSSDVSCTLRLVPTSGRDRHGRVRTGYYLELVTSVTTGPAAEKCVRLAQDVTLAASAYALLGEPFHRAPPATISSTTAERTEVVSDPLALDGSQVQWRWERRDVEQIIESVQPGSRHGV